MKKSVMVAGLLLLLPLAASAQEVPKAELYWGYSFVRNFNINHHGWNGSIAGVINPNLAIVADISGQYANPGGSLFGFPFEEDIHLHTFMLGPRVSETVNGRWTPYAHVLVGVSRVSDNVDIGFGGTTVTDHFNKVGFATAVGGGIDLWVTPRVAVRLAQAEYFLTRFGETKNETPRLGFGLLFRLGNKAQ